MISIFFLELLGLGIGIRLVCEAIWEGVHLFLRV